MIFARIHSMPCVHLITAACFGLSFGAAEFDKSVFLMQVHVSALHDHDDRKEAGEPLFSAAGFARGDDDCLKLAGLSSVGDAKGNDLPAQSNAQEAVRDSKTSRFVSSVTTFLGVFLKLLTCAVVVDGAHRVCFLPQNGCSLLECRDALSPMAGLRQRMGLPGIVLVFATLAVSRLVFDDSELLIAFIGGGLYLVVRALMTFGREPIAKKVVSEYIAESAMDENASVLFHELDEHVPLRLHASAVSHEVDEYVPLWELAPEVWAKYLPESHEDID